MSNQSSRRGFLKNAAIAAGALGASRLIPGGSLLGSAEAAVGEEPPAVFIFYMGGGYNALFGSADSFIGNGAFGTTAAGVKRVGTSDLYVDNRTFGTLPNSTLNKMATIGVRHGISSHPAAQSNLVLDGAASRLIKLSTSLPGTAAVRCAVVGQRMPAGNHRAINGVSLQQVRDLGTTIAALGGSTDPNAPARAVAADGISASEVMSKGKLDANPTSGKTLIEGYPAASAQLRQAVTPLNYANVAAAYGVMPNAAGVVPTAINANNTRMQILGAELMIKAGANVVIAEQGGWDSHGDNNGNEVRNKLLDEGTMAALKVFTDRTLAMTDRNVVTVIMGDFSRSLPGSNHQANLSATVIGKYVKLGTTGRVDNDVNLPAGTPSIDGLWAYIAAVSGASGSPFGNNPHNLVL